MKNFFLFLCAVFAIHAEANAQIGSTSALTDRYGTFYTFSARALNWKDYYVFQSSRVFKGTGDRSGASYSIKDFNSVLGINAGLAQDCDVILITNFYQNTNRPFSVPGKGSATMDKFLVNFRYAPYRFSENKLQMGFMITAKFSRGQANIPFQNYSAGRAEVGVTWLTSYFQRPDDPDAGYTLNVNLQYYNHLDKGFYVGWLSEDSLRNSGNNALANEGVAFGNASSFRFGVGGAFPFKVGGSYLYLMGDLYGQMFLTNTPNAAYTRQNSGFFALGAKYQIASWMAFHLGGEYQIMKGTKTTYSNALLGVEDLTVSKSDYPNWRVFVGISLPISPRARVLEKQFVEGQQEQNLDQQEIRKKEVQKVIYSEQEVQKRKENFVPVRDMRKDYKNDVNGLINVLTPKDKKVEESDDDSAASDTTSTKH